MQSPIVYPISKIIYPMHIGEEYYEVAFKVEWVLPFKCRIEELTSDRIRYGVEFMSDVMWNEELYTLHENAAIKKEAKSWQVKSLLLTQINHDISNLL